MANAWELDQIQVKVVVLVWYFFFQAEDGIRDGHVTGVQTCALPICPGAELACEQKVVDDRGEPVGFLRDHLEQLLVQLRLEIDVVAPEGQRSAVDRRERSEERRVGKGCGWRGWACECRNTEEARLCE